jgi:hypothetical protein
MPLTVELTAPPEDFDAHALGQALARMTAIVAQTTRIRLNVTSSFDRSVRRALVGGPTRAAPYTQEREFGVALAKTITQADGSIDVIVDATLFSRWAEAGDAERTFEHEGLHIALEERGESMADLRHHRGPAAGGAAEIFASMASVSAEEYRVERVLWRASGDVRADSHLAHFGTIAWRIEETIRAASTAYQHDLDRAVIGTAVSDAFLALATSTAYVAAEIDATGGQRDVDVAVDVYDRLLGEKWRAVIGELRRLPAGDVPTTVQRLDLQAHGVAARLEDWLAHIGFTWLEDAAGRLAFGVLNAAEWTRPTGATSRGRGARRARPQAPSDA